MLLFHHKKEVNLIKNEKCLFSGYCEECKGYRLLNLKSKKLVILRGMIFVENETRKICDCEAHLKTLYMKIEEVKDETLPINEIKEYGDIPSSTCSPPPTPPCNTQQK